MDRQCPEYLLTFIGIWQRASFDTITNSLTLEAAKWFQKSFSTDEKYKVKNLKGFVQKFIDSYCSLPAEATSQYY